jgi:hypothetical protein
MRSMSGTVYSPPPATGTRFNDVPADSIFSPWIEALATTGITGRCGFFIHPEPSDHLLAAPGQPSFAARPDAPWPRPM